MNFLNHSEIDYMVQRFRHHQVLGPAARFLAAFRDEVDRRSDGWAYWPKPARACSRLFELFRDHHAVTDRDLKRALVPVRSFCTRNNFPFPKVE